MADVAESIVPPPAADQTDNLTIWWVPNTGTGGATPGIADVTAPKVTEVGATGAVRITYSFTNDGWSVAASQTKTKDERLTLKQPLEALGATDVALSTLKYVESSAATAANTVLTAGQSGFLVERRGVPNKTLAAAGQKVRVYPVTLGEQLPGPTDGTGKFTVLQEVSLTGGVGLPVALV